MNQKIKSKLQSSDKGSYYNYLLLGILGIFCAVDINLLSTDMCFCNFRNFSLMKLDHEKHFTGYVYINNKYIKCKISAVLNQFLI
jgi:hypothetical protein